MRLFACILAMAAAIGPAWAQDLPSWNEGPVKDAIIDFVTAAMTEGGPGWVEPEDRIATFDNDGTLWTEHPVYFQFMFVSDRIRHLAPRHPEWKLQPPFKGILEGDTKAVAASGEHGVTELMAVTHAWMTAEAFEEIVSDWISTARHPRFDRPYDSLIYQPMVELMDYQMLEYTTSGDGPSLAMIVHHTDGEREYAYDRDTHIGRLDKAMTDAPAKGWHLIDMARDWSTIYPEP